MWFRCACACAYPITQSLCCTPIWASPVTRARRHDTLRLRVNDVSDTRCKPNRSGSRGLGAYCGSAEFAGTSYDSEPGCRPGSQFAGRRSTIIYQRFLCMYYFIQSVLGYILNIDRRVRLGRRRLSLIPVRTARRGICVVVIV
jgi:hypothetical protein